MEIRNDYTPHVLDLLDDMSLNGRSSLGRSAIKKAITERSEEYALNQIEIIDEYGAWIKKDEGKYNMANPELQQALIDLNLQNVKVEVNTPFLDDLITGLENYDGEDLKGLKADAFAVLYEGLLEEKEENE